MVGRGSCGRREREKIGNVGEDVCGRATRGRSRAWWTAKVRSDDGGVVGGAE